MTFRQWLGKKIAGNFYSKTNGHLTDDERAKALAIRRQETALKQAEKQVEFMERLAKLETHVNPKESVTDLAIKEAIPIFMEKLRDQNLNKAKPVQTTLEDHKEGTSLDQETLTKKQIKSILELNPKLVKEAKNYEDKEVLGYISKGMPHLKSKDLNNILSEVRKYGN